MTSTLSSFEDYIHAGQQAHLPSHRPDREWHIIGRDKLVLACSIQFATTPPLNYLPKTERSLPATDDSDPVSCNLIQLSHSMQTHTTINTFSDMLLHSLYLCRMILSLTGKITHIVTYIAAMRSNLPFTLILHCIRNWNIHCCHNGYASLNFDKTLMTSELVHHRRWQIIFTAKARASEDPLRLMVEAIGIVMTITVGYCLAKHNIPGQP